MADFTIAVLDGALAGSVGATLDMLDFAARSCATAGRPALTWCVVGSSDPLPLSSGLSLRTRPFAHHRPRAGAMLVIPGLGLDHPADASGIDGRYGPEQVARRIARPDVQALARLARRHHDAGGRVCASCSGVLVLGLAGLLAGRRVTTHWKLAPLLARLFPDARLDVPGMVVEDGRVTTAGAAMAQIDLMAHLLRRQAGREVADLVMRYLLLDSRTTQARHMVWQTLDAGGDDTLRRFEALIEAGLPEPPGVAAAARRLNLTERTLSRRIAKATGAPPRAVIQAVRMREAQRLLETTDLPVEEIAARVGYANATSLRKLTLKLTRLTPALLRRPAEPAESTG